MLGNVNLINCLAGEVLILSVGIKTWLMGRELFWVHGIGIICLARVGGIVYDLIGACLISG